MERPAVADRASEPTPPSRLCRRLPAAVLLACCAALLAAAPIAAGRSTRSSSSPHASAPSQTPAVAQPSPAPAVAPNPASAPAPAQPPQPRHHGGAGATKGAHAPPSSSSTQSTPSSAPAGAQPGAEATTERSSQQGPARQRRAAARRQAAHSGASAQPQAVTQPQAAIQQAPATQPASAVKPASASRKEERERRKAEATRRKEARKAERSKETGEHGKEGSAPSQPGSEGTPSTPTLTAAVSPSPVAAIASSPSPTPTVAATPVAASVPSVAGVSLQAGAGHRSRAARRAPAARARRASGSTSAAASVAGAGVVSLARSSRPAPHTRRGGSSPAGSGAARKAGRSSPIVTTITRIVDVVPTPVRLLIAVLVALALALAVRSRFAAVRARRLERQRGQLLEDVGLLQAALLPVAPERLGPVGTSAAYKPADGPGAGGDFYDVFALEDGQVAVIVGDVSGHGRRALPHTALLRFTLRAYLEAGLSPRDAVQTAGAVLDRQLGGQFATVVAATYNPRERVLVYACAGHPAPVVLGGRSDASAIEPVIASSSPPIGVGMRTGTRQTTVSVPGRAQVCFYTDGVTEARVGSELFGAERLRGTLAELGEQASASAVLDSVVERADARPDDMAACLLRVEGGEDAPAVLVEELELDRDSAASPRTERFLLACGIEREELSAVIHAAGAAAGRDGTAVLELHRADGAPQVTLRRDHLRYMPVPQTEVEVSR